MKRQLDPKKIKMYTQPSASTSAAGMDAIFIGYDTEGGAMVPTSMYVQMMNHYDYANKIRKAIIDKNLKLVLFEAVKHSQYVNFEPVR